MRTFISIDIPGKIKKEIKKIQEQLPEFRGKIIELENLHLTLKFLRELSEEKIEEIMKRLNEINFSKFEAVVESIGFFSKDFIRIIWLHVSGCDEIQKAIDEKLKDLFEKEKRFMSHLTIARIKSVKDKNNFVKIIKEIKIIPIKFPVEKFRLKKSTLNEKGPIYETLEEYILK